MAMRRCVVVLLPNRTCSACMLLDLVSIADREDLLTSSHIACASNPEEVHNRHQHQAQSHVWVNGYLSAYDIGDRLLLEAP